MKRSAIFGWYSHSCRFFQKNDCYISFSNYNGLPPSKRRRFSRCSGSASSVPNALGRSGSGISQPESSGGQSQDLGHKAREMEAEKEFYMDLLSSASTKREAKPYLARFQSSNSKQKENHDTAKKQICEASSQFSGFNLMDILKAELTGTGSQQRLDFAPTQDETTESIHVALVKLRNPQLLDDMTLDGVGRTLSLLSRLGLSCCVVIDVGPGVEDASSRKVAIDQADRLSVVIDATHGPDSRRLDSIIEVSASTGKLSILSRSLLLSPLRQGHVVVATPVGYTRDTQKSVILPANDVVLALTKELAGLEFRPSLEEDAKTTARRVNSLQDQVTLDRVILLDSVGGIPSIRQRPHVFINLEQEFDDIVDELTSKVEVNTTNRDSQRKMPISPLGMSNPISKFAEEEVISLLKELGKDQLASGKDGRLDHLDNLKLLQSTLSILPPSSSGIIVTPNEVAVAAKNSQNVSPLSAVGTRRHRNPLIHNLLTDKPIQSASLPPGRLGAIRGSLIDPSTHSTFVKRGMPLTLLPDPRVNVWAPKGEDGAILTLDDPRIDLPRLVHLIEDSFGRKLDVGHYMKRVKPRLAGLIIAGEYEGGAILTWETPPGLSDDGSEEVAARKVPYLDKFAVLRRSQGVGGVADIVFNAMVRTCFPQGVCWRSRANNPVNKWYFERSRGTWKLPGTNWTMFWTTEGIPENHQRFLDYEGVCRTIEPSWADNKQILD